MTRERSRGKMTSTTQAYSRLYRLLPVAAGAVLVVGTFLVDLLVAGDGPTAPVQAAMIVVGCALTALGFVSRQAKLGAGLARVSVLVLVTASLVVLLEGAFRIVEYDFARHGRAAKAVPIYYRRPMLHAGEGFLRRGGPASWRGKPLSAFTSLHAVDDGPYAGEQSVVIEYDALGFRNPRDLTDWEIAVAGDSFVELGFLPYEQLFTTHLAKRLGVRVKNLGVSYTGPLSQEFFLRTYGKAPSAREAVLCFFEGNDFHDLEREMRYAEHFRNTGQPLVREPAKQTSLLRAAHDIVVSGRTLTPAAAPGGTRYGQNAWFRAGTQELPMTVGVAPRAWEEVPEEQRTRLVDALKKFADTAKGGGMRPWLVCIPDAHRVLYGQIRYLDPESKLARWQPSDFAGGLGWACRELGIEFIDSYPALRREAEAGRTPYNLITDTHLNALGSRVMGDVLADAIGSAK